jgi:hypothetical protein
VGFLERKSYMTWKIAALRYIYTSVFSNIIAELYPKALRSLNLRSCGDLFLAQSSYNGVLYQGETSDNYEMSVEKRVSELAYAIGSDRRGGS